MPFPDNVFLYPVEYLTYSTGNNLTTRANGQKEYKLMDHLGSTRVVLDNNGITQEYDYDPFGRQVVVTAATTGGPVRESFIGKEKDSEDNLGDFGVRKYDESLGRFMSTDVLWEKYRGLTPYQYGGDNPILIKDPTGLKLNGGFSVINNSTQNIQISGSSGIENVTDGNSSGIIESEQRPYLLPAGARFESTVTAKIQTLSDGTEKITYEYKGIITESNGHTTPVPVYDVDAIILAPTQGAVIENGPGVGDNIRVSNSTHQNVSGQPSPIHTAGGLLHAELNIRGPGSQDGAVVINDAKEPKTISISTAGPILGTPSIEVGDPK